jgi:hypothetical protein
LVHPLTKENQNDYKLVYYIYPIINDKVSDPLREILSLFGQAIKISLKYANIIYLVKHEAIAVVDPNLS